MKNLVIGVIGGAILGGGVMYATQNFNDTQTPNSNDKDISKEVADYSYFIGVSVGSNFKAQDLEISQSNFKEGFSNAYNGQPLRLNEEELEAARDNLVAATQKRRENQLQKELEDNKKSGADFLAENKKNPEVKELDSGLQYRILKEGTGKKVAEATSVSVHYEGRTVDGNIFDSSYERDAPIELDARPSNVIKAWQEIIPLLTVGDEYEIYSSSDLGYGDAGSPPTIPPGAVLIFKIEVISAE